MEAVVYVLMIAVVLLTALKLTFLKKVQVAIIAAMCALFTGCIWPVAINQSQNEIASWLGNPQLMLDTSVVLSLEVCLQIAYGLLAARLLYDGVVSQRTLWIYRILRFFPGLLIFPVLYYLLVQVIYTFPGVDFATVAWGTAVGIGLVLPGIALLLRWLLPEKDLRLELLFLLAVLVLILGIVTTVNGTTSFKGSDPIEWLALAAFCGLALICALAGYAYRHYKFNKYYK